MPQTPFIRKSGQIIANGGSVKVSVAGYGSLGIEVGGIFSGTLGFKGRVGSAYVDLAASAPNDPATLVLSTTAPGTWVCNIAGLTEVEVLATAFASGAAKIDLLAAGGGLAV